MDIDTAMAISETIKPYGHLLTKIEKAMIFSARSLDEINEIVKHALGRSSDGDGIDG